MFQLKQCIVGAVALVGLLASTFVTAVPFQMLVEDDPAVEQDVGAAGSNTFVELVTATHGNVLGGDLHLTPYGRRGGAYVSSSFESGFALIPLSAGVRARSGNNSFASGVGAAHAPLPGVQALAPSANVATSPTPEAGGAGSFAEPASVALLGLGLAGLAYSSRRWHRQHRQLGH